MSRRCVLVIDDEEGFRAYFRYVLEPLGYEVVTVADARAAGAWVRRRRFDLVILDGYLSGAICLDALRRMRKDRPDQRIAVLSMMSGVLAEEALSLGAWRCQAKPSDPDDLAALVAAACANEDDDKS